MFKQTFNRAFLSCLFNLILVVFGLLLTSCSGTDFGLFSESNGDQSGTGQVGTTPVFCDGEGACNGYSTGDSDAGLMDQSSGADSQASGIGENNHLDSGRDGDPIFLSDGGGADTSGSIEDSGAPDPLTLLPEGWIIDKSSGRLNAIYPLAPTGVSLPYIYLSHIGLSDGDITRSKQLADQYLTANSSDNGNPQSGVLVYNSIVVFWVELSSSSYWNTPYTTTRIFFSKKGKVYTFKFWDKCLNQESMIKQLVTNIEASSI